MTLKELRLNIKWWESKRWIFNLAIIFVGSISFYHGYSRSNFFWDPSDTFIIIIRWMVFANILYSLGVLIELFDWYYLKNKLRIVRFRLPFFLIGTVFSSLLAFWCGFFIFSKPHLW